MIKLAKPLLLLRLRSVRTGWMNFRSAQVTLECRHPVIPLPSGTYGSMTQDHLYWKQIHDGCRAWHRSTKHDA